MIRLPSFAVCLLLSSFLSAADHSDLISPGRRILFLGDSITHAGDYISLIEASVRSEFSAQVPVLINLGLPSETCSGLSEPDHPFPRPDVHERLERALDKVRPDVVFACYGMNDGIYYPFSEQRFAAYRRGIDRLIKKVKAAGARLVLMTPPAFDPLPLKQQGKLLPAGADKYAWFSIYEGYDDVLKRYSKWIMQQQDRVDLTIDLHTPVNLYIAQRREQQPDFTMSPDGVHLNEEGHRVLAKVILVALGKGKEALGKENIQLHPDRLKLVKERQKLLHAAWLRHVGHQRPGVKSGLPLEEAFKKAAALDRRIRQ